LTIIETSRLNLSELTTEDASFILKLYNDPDFITYIGDKGIKSNEDAENFIDSGPKQSYKVYNHGLYLVQLKDDTSIGICGLLKRDNLDLPDIGFAILPDHRRMGYTYEASKAVIHDAIKRLNINKISAISSPDNDASIKLLIKLGFTFKEIVKLDSNKEPTQLYTIHLDS